MKADDPKVSVAVFVGITLVVFVALVAFARYPSLFNRGREYRTTFANVAGLNVGDQVRYGGLLVGSVTHMEVDSTNPSLVAVEFRVRRRTPVKVDTRATITQVGFLGEPYLALEPGSATAPELPAGGTLASDANLNFQEAMNKLARFFERTDTLFIGIDRFSKTKPFERLDRTLTRVDQLVSSTADRGDRVLARLDTASLSVNQILAHTDRLISRFDTTMNVAGPELRQTQREALTTLREMRSLVA